MAQYKGVSQLEVGPQSQDASNADTLASKVQNETNIKVACDSHIKGTNKNIEIDNKPRVKNVTKQEVTEVQGATDPPDYQSSLKGSSEQQQPKDDLSSKQYHHYDLEANRNNGIRNQLNASGEDEPDASLDTNVCVFCLDGGKLIHMCSCSVLAHKDCALEYIRFPGGMNDKCCQCRTKLKYEVLDKKTPMRGRDLIAFLLLITAYLTIIGLSFYGTMILIPKGDKNVYLWMAMVGNIGILWPLLIVIIFTLSLGCCSSYQYRHSRSDPIIYGGCSGCYCGDGCGDCGDCNGCGDGGGEGCGMIICVICFLVIFAVLIAVSAYLVFTLFKFYKSFSLRSKKEIEFQHEGRRINTLG